MRSADYLTALFSLEGKRAFVTGASRGLGLAFAEAFAKAGASVILAGRKQRELELAGDSLRASGHAVSQIVIDVTNTESVNEAIRTAESEIGPIDIRHEPKRPAPVRNRHR